MKTAAYVRVSSDKQDTTRQRISISACAGRLSEVIGEWFEDSEGKNPRHRAGKRKEFQRLLAAVQAGSVQTIIVDSQDRFGTKDAFEWGSFVSLLREHDCRLLDSTGRDLTADDDGAVLTGVVGALTSRREQKEKANRSIKGKVTNAKRGEYQGGYAPHGMDVVCFSPEGKEKWRTVYVAHLDRYKVYPDGTRERFKGKNATPAKDTTDTLRLRPSIESERIKTVKLIFKWFATEDISPGKIADRLNDLQSRPVFSEAWYKQTIKELLRNPVYLGLPTWNKRAASEFVEFVDGQFREISGKTSNGRRRKPSDYIQPPKPEFPPIIDGETWNTVQRKLAESSSKAPKQRHSPQTAELWLRPFMVCGHCEKPMHATNGRTTRGLWQSYFCGTYNRFGANNPTGCHCHRVKHEVIEKVVAEYLKRTAPKLVKLLKATDGSSFEEIRQILESVKGTAEVFNGVACEVLSFVEENGSDRTTSKLLRQGKGFSEIYGVLFEKVRPKLEKQIAAKQAELDAKLDEYQGLPERLRQRAIERMEPMQAEIDELRGQLVDLRQPYNNLRAELANRRESLDRAKRTINREGAGRQKTDALRGVIDRIVCHYRHTKTARQSNNGKSILERVEIYPVQGEQVCFSAGDKPGPC